MPSKLLISISDLHLGRGNPQDSFIDQPDGVRAFARQIADGVAKTNVPLTFIFNGDIFDLWELVTPTELGDGQAAYDAISNGLLVPTDDAAELQRLATGVGARLDWSLDAHPEIVVLFNALHQAGAKVHVNVGNHDHQLDNKATQAVFLRSLTSHGAAATPLRWVGTIWMRTWGSMPSMATSSPVASRGRRSSSPWQESPWTRPSVSLPALRLERAREQRLGWVQHPNMGQIVTLLFRLVFFREGPVQQFKKYCSDYFRAVRDKGVPLVQSKVLRFLYDRWKERTDQESATSQGSGERSDDLTDEDLRAVHDQLESLGLQGLQAEGMELEAAASAKAKEPLRRRRLSSRRWLGCRVWRSLRNRPRVTNTSKACGPASRRPPTASHCSIARRSGRSPSDTRTRNGR